MDAEEAVSQPLSRAEEQGGLISEILRTAALSKSLKASPRPPATPNPLKAKSPRSPGDRKASTCPSPVAHPHAEGKPHTGIPRTDATCCLWGGPRPSAELHRHHSVAPHSRGTPHVPVVPGKPELAAQGRHIAGPGQEPRVQPSQCAQTERT